MTVAKREAIRKQEDLFFAHAVIDATEIDSLVDDMCKPRPAFVVEFNSFLDTRIQACYPVREQGSH